MAKEKEQYIKTENTGLDEKNISLNIYKEDDLDKIIKLGKAISNKNCLKVFRTVGENPLNMSEISKLTNLPISSVSNHIDALEAADLIYVYYQPSLKGHVKICNNKTWGVSLDFTEKKLEEKTHKQVYEMGVGMFTDCNVLSPCGMTSTTATFALDSPNQMFHPDRASAELFWFSSGYVTYKFPNDYNVTSKIKSLEFSLELCSETMYYREKYPSDITFIVNGVELFTWTSPGDFGGRRGKFSPEFWPITSTQFGMLKTFTIDSKGIKLDNIPINNNINLSNLNLEENNIIELTIKIKDDALHKGGINIFGKNFGDYNQSIILTINYINEKK